jgi:hypothetical protein
MLFFRKGVINMTRKRITVALEDSLIKDLRHLSVEKDVRFNELMAQAVAQFLKKACPK